MSYLREARIGDQLSVSLWQNVRGKSCSRTDKVYEQPVLFQVHKGDNVISEAEMEFYPPDLEF